MAEERPTLIVPVESQVRELDAKLLLAAVAAERGFAVILGSRAYIHHGMASYPRGIYLAKSMRRASERMFGIIGDLGHEIVAWDEEGLVRFPDPFFYERRLSAKTLARVKILLAWGEDDARAFAHFPGYHGCPIEITGNPRIDLMRPQLRGYFARECKAIRERHGQFILINTNFSGLNHFHDGLSELRQNLAPGGQVKDPFMAGRAAFRNEVLTHFKALVPAVSRQFPERKVIVRPHPSESHELWRDLARGLDNVEILNEGNVYPWLLACAALIHNGCTTGVEAAVLGTPAIAFQPVRDETYDMTLPNSLSHQASDLKDVEKTVHSILAGEIAVRDDPEVRGILAAHIAAIDGPLAADRVVDVLEAAGAGEARTALSKRLAARIHLSARTAVKRYNRNRPGHRNNLEFHAHRFPGVDSAEIRGRIEHLGRLLGRFDGVRVAPLSDHVFTISR